MVTIITQVDYGQITFKNNLIAINSIISECLVGARRNPDLLEEEQGQGITMCINVASAAMLTLADVNNITTMSTSNNNINDDYSNTKELQLSSSEFLTSCCCHDNWVFDALKDQRVMYYLVQRC